MIDSHLHVLLVQRSSIIRKIAAVIFKIFVYDARNTLRFLNKYLETLSAYFPTFANVLLISAKNFMPRELKIVSKRKETKKLFHVHCILSFLRLFRSSPHRVSSPLSFSPLTEFPEASIRANICKCSLSIYPSSRPTCWEDIKEPANPHSDVFRLIHWRLHSYRRWIWHCYEIFIDADRFSFRPPSRKYFRPTYWKPVQYPWKSSSSSRVSPATRAPSLENNFYAGWILAGSSSLRRF